MFAAIFMGMPVPGMSPAAVGRLVDTPGMFVETNSCRLPSERTVDKLSVNSSPPVPHESAADGTDD
jgi:hypothetical protein